ncbi:hypothetical protein L198_06048 [Cryptococcus wingfieldii CBS 7118]|uniref:Uncharacterized protein n=1 Tax=Cryptococcus wingfieldii CBS 7118 TaxID=1295528 RepID=A0A1E3IQ74_9TREE|nr:hypothetical protein L198_06048 [Cryptococcus wingfieldii CBS 7118]ODN90732.1 hypothetical protein L198_06048 [Cryptococcus wingfieldii CBS 7118]
MHFSSLPILQADPDQATGTDIIDDPQEGGEPLPVDEFDLGAEDAEDNEEYATIASPGKYFILLVLFVVAPVGAGVYFYGGGKERVKQWRGQGYEKVEEERV